MTRMTHIDDAPPLLTDADVLDRVTELVGPAAVRRQLWLLFLDGDAVPGEGAGVLGREGLSPHKMT
jgi:hypothetical protein